MAVLHEGFLDLVAVLACSSWPVGYCAFIHPERVNNRLGRTSIGQ
jgi:hypothetical protein